MTTKKKFHTHIFVYFVFLLELINCFFYFAGFNWKPFGFRRFNSVITYLWIFYLNAILLIYLLTLLNLVDSHIYCYLFNFQFIYIILYVFPVNLKN